MQQLKHSSFRQRVYQMADGSIQLVVGSDPAPEGAILLADHDVKTETIVVPHVEPAPVEPQG